jgi:hypothetical protein
MTKIQIRRDQSDRWSSINPLLADGEMGVELDTLKIKIGDGSRNWDALPYVAGEGAVGLVPGDNVTELVNDAGYLTESEVNNLLQGNLPDGGENPNVGKYLQSGDNVTELVNDAGYITGVEALDDIGDVSVAGATEDQYLRYNGTNWVAETVTSLAPGDNVTELVNDAGYLTDAEVNQIIADGGYITEVEALDDIGDVSVAGATENQYLRYNGTNWVAETVTGIADSLQFQGTVDCTTDEAPGAPLTGWFYFNTGTGPALASWVGITTDVTDGDRVVYGADNQWHIVGNVNDGGNITLDSLSVVVEDPFGDSDLSYNNSTGVFTYTPPDLVTSNVRLAASVRTSFLQLASRADVTPPADFDSQEDANTLDVAILANHETRIPKSMTEAEANDLDVYHNVDTDQITVKGVIPSDMRRMDSLPTP